MNCFNCKFLDAFSNHAKCIKSHAILPEYGTPEDCPLKEELRKRHKSYLKSLLSDYGIAMIVELLAEIAGKNIFYAALVTLVYKVPLFSTTAIISDKNYSEYHVPIWPNSYGMEPKIITIKMSDHFLRLRLGFSENFSIVEEK